MPITVTGNYVSTSLNVHNTISAKTFKIRNYKANIWHARNH